MSEYPDFKVDCDVCAFPLGMKRHLFYYGGRMMEACCESCRLIGKTRGAADVKTDSVSKPAHYMQHPSGVECITITEHMGFNLGNAIKYIWRAGLKGGATEDLRKAQWYITRELKRLEAKND